MRSLCSHVLPLLSLWKKLYGKCFVYECDVKRNWQAKPRGCFWSVLIPFSWCRAALDVPQVWERGHSIQSPKFSKDIYVFWVSSLYSELHFASIYWVSLCPKTPRSSHGEQPKPSPLWTYSNYFLTTSQGACSALMERHHFPEVQCCALSNIPREAGCSHGIAASETCTDPALS